MSKRFHLLGNTFTVSLVTLRIVPVSLNLLLGYHAQVEDYTLKMPNNFDYLSLAQIFTTLSQRNHYV
nr:hypothetical protein [Alkalicoccobacillus plakortidis]